MMIKRFAVAAFCLLLAAATASSAAAQYQYQPPADNSGPDSTDSGDAVARLQVKLSELEEQMRNLQGTIEKLSYENRQLKAQIDKNTADVDYRLSALEKKSAATPAAPVAPAAPEAAPAPATENENTGPLHADAIPSSENYADESEGKPAAAPSAPAKHFASPRDHYNYAFGLLNDAKYEDAGAAFAGFIKEYPKDPLIGNAYYWLGETYYVRHDYVRAADDFRQGYEAMPTGPKASDNLLKLAMALGAMHKDKESCVVLRQVVSRFGHASAGIKSRAEQEINRIGCS